MAIVLATVGFGLMLTVVVIGLPTISVKLGATQSDLEWIVGAFQITIAALMFPAGFLGDRYGRKRFLLGRRGAPRRGLSGRDVGDLGRARPGGWHIPCG